jgi:hypothetical protein
VCALPFLAAVAAAGCVAVSQVRFEVGYYSLKPDIKVIAPWREWDLNSRTKLIAYAGGQRHGSCSLPACDVIDAAVQFERRMLTPFALTCIRYHVASLPVDLYVLRDILLWICCFHCRSPEAAGIPVPSTKRGEPPFSMDANLLHISYEGNALEDPWAEPDESMFTRSVSPENVSAALMLAQAYAT